MTDKFKDHYENAEKVERFPPLPLRRESMPVEPYPLKALGKLLEEAARAIIDKVQCPDAIAAQSVLGAAALATQAHADVVHPATRVKGPISLFLVTVTASGERKTAADRFALDPIILREAELRQRYERDHKLYGDATDIYERERARFLKQNKNAQDISKELASLSPPTLPRAPLLTVPEPTLEGLHKLLAIGEPSIGLFNDEGGLFVGGHGMTDETRLRTASGLSSLWDGTPVKRGRGDDGWSDIRGRRLSLHLMIQPGISDGLLANPVLVQQGILSRMLVAAPASRAGTRMQRPPSPKTEPALKRYRDRILKLLRHGQRDGKRIIAELQPRAMSLSAEAYPTWSAFADECETHLADGQKFESIRGFANKLAEQALRIASVFELLEDVEATDISAATMKRGIELARYYAGEALRLSQESTCSVEIIKAEKFLAWLHKRWDHPMISLPDIYQFGLPETIRDKAAASSIVNILVQHGRLYDVPGGAIVNGKKRRDV